MKYLIVGIVCSKRKSDETTRKEFGSKEQVLAFLQENEKEPLDVRLQAITVTDCDGNMITKQFYDEDFVTGKVFLRGEFL